MAVECRENSTINPFISFINLLNARNIGCQAFMVPTITIYTQGLAFHGLCVPSFNITLFIKRLYIAAKLCGKQHTNTCFYTFQFEVGVSYFTTYQKVKSFMVTEYFKSLKTTKNRHE